MIYVLMGQDDFSKRLFWKNLIKTGFIDGKSVFETDLKTQLPTFLGGDLFGMKSVYKVIDSNPAELETSLLGHLLESANIFVFEIERLDNRKISTRHFLNTQGIIVKNFPLPIGEDLQMFIRNYLSKTQHVFSSNVMVEFLRRVGAVQTDYEEPVYSLWQIAGELDKLILLAGEKKEISLQEVQAIVPESLEINVFSLTNAIAKKETGFVAEFLNKFYTPNAYGDDKTKTIQLVSLLAESLRSLLLVKECMRERVSDVEIINQTKWKPARLAILKKLSQNFSSKALLSVLKKFEYLDLELKTTNTPPRVLMELILVQFML